jgi:hypothetical protein
MYAVRVMQLQLNLSGDSSSKKFKQCFVGACGGFSQSPHLAGVWSQAFDFAFVCLAGIWL